MTSSSFELSVFELMGVNCIKIFDINEMETFLYTKRMNIIIHMPR